ncbi:MAG: carboxypeptidase regulatory-like domain-containing protein [Gemmatimonadaceae bacterium]
MWRRPARAWGVLTLAAVTSLLTRALPGQVIRGAISDRATGAPLAGAIITGGKDSASAGASRVMSDVSGQYSWRPPAAGDWVLEVHAIGYRPTQQRISVQPGETVRQDIGLERAPLSLSSVRVERESSCSARADLAADASLVWNDVWSALAGAATSRSVRRETASVMRFVRTREPMTGLVLDETRTSRTGANWQSFTAVAASELARTGFRVEHSDGTVTFNAPDAETLIAPEFIARHCYAVTRRDDAEPLLGIAFWPHKRFVSEDVEGVLWADARTRELRRVEFRYPALTALDPSADFGGFASYLRQADGSWIIDAWQIRVPIIQRTRRITALGTRRLGEDTQDSVTLISEEGGFVLGVGQGRLPVIAGEVRDSSGRPMPGVDIELAGTEVSARSDSVGAYQLTNVVPGRYLVRATRVGTATTPTVWAETTLVVDGNSPRRWSPQLAVANSIALACPARKGKTTDTALMLLVRDASTQRPRRNQRLQMQLISFEGRGLQQLRQRESRQERTSDWRGVIAICDIVASGAVRFRLPDASSWGESVRLDGQFNLLTIGVDSAAGTVRVTGAPAVETTATALTPTAPVAGRGSLSGRVISADSTGTPLAGAEVWIAGSARSIRTSSTGGFQFDDLPLGNVALQVRHLGYSPSQRVVTLGSAGGDTLTVRLSPLATLLPTVAVTANAELLRVGMREFASRRQAGFGHFADAKDIERTHARSLSSVVMTIAGGLVLVRINKGGFTGGGYAVASRRFRTLSSSEPCFSQVFLNGTRMYPEMSGDVKETPFALEQLPLEDVVGVEVYKSAAETPLQFTGPAAACGTVVIWTK